MNLKRNANDSATPLRHLRVIPRETGDGQDVEVPVSELRPDPVHGIGVHDVAGGAAEAELALQAPGRVAASAMDTAGVPPRWSSSFALMSIILRTPLDL